MQKISQNSLTEEQQPNSVIQLIVIIVVVIVIIITIIHLRQSCITVINGDSATQLDCIVHYRLIYN